MGVVQTPPEEFNWDRGHHVLGQGSGPAATQQCDWFQAVTCSDK